MTLKNLILEYFKVATIQEIRWGHAVNSSQKLKDFLKQKTLLFAEGDVRLSNNGNLIMSHDANQKSDLSFLKWFSTLVKCKRGIKIDFKDPHAVNKVVNIINQQKFNNPIILNADISQDSYSPKALFEGNLLLKQLKKVKHRRKIFSLGWRTTKKTKKNKLIITKNEVKKMLNIVANTNELITFPVRITYLKNSFMNLTNLLNLNKEYSLTLWKGQEDKVTYSEKKFISYLNPNKFFQDL